MNSFKAYLGFIITFLVIDAVWISIFVKPLYKQNIGHLLSDSPNMVAGIIFYLGYALGAIVLVVRPAQSKLNALFLGGILGFFAYGTFTVTSYALLDGWALSMVLTDLTWGAFLTGVSAWVGYIASRGTFGVSLKI